MCKVNACICNAAKNQQHLRGGILFKEKNPASAYETNPLRGFPSRQNYPYITGKLKFGGDG